MTKRSKNTPPEVPGQITARPFGFSGGSHWRRTVLAAAYAGLAGCGGSTTRTSPDPSKPDISKGQCTVDADCRDGFCDRTGLCGSVNVEATARFGTTCTLPPRNPNGTVNGEQNTCGPYLCLEGRCRSCVVDAECQTELGAPNCGRVLESSRWPGNSCGNYGSSTASAPTRRTSVPPASQASVTRLAVEVLKSYPHSTDSFTEGLTFQDGALFESTGNVGSSQLRRLSLETGEAAATVALAADLFGEGLARHGDRLVQLTLSSGRALVWDLKSLKQVGDLPYQGEGWGLCHDGTHFVMSDGTSSLQIRNSETFAVEKTIAVHSNAATQFGFLRLNELECVGDDVFANVFEYRELVRISLASGEITAIIDTRSLLQHPDVSPGASDKALDLNGIAYVPESGHFLLTGKFWPRVFEVRFVEDELFR